MTTDELKKLIVRYIDAYMPRCSARELKNKEYMAWYNLIFVKYGSTPNALLNWARIINQELKKLENEKITLDKRE